MITLQRLVTAEFLIPLQIYVYELSITLDDTLDYSALTDDELHRATMYINHADTARFVQTRTALKYLMRLYLDKHDYSESIICTNEYGKPMILDNSLYFNVSHSHDKAIIAVSPHYHVGVDIEQASTTNALQSELQSLVYSPLDSQLLCFAQIWVVKEAILKAIGTGLHTPMTELSVQPYNAKPSTRQAIKITSLTSKYNDVQVFLLNVLGDYVVSIAFRQPS